MPWRRFPLAVLSFGASRRVRGPARWRNMAATAARRSWKPRSPASARRWEPEHVGYYPGRRHRQPHPAIGLFQGAAAGRHAAGRRRGTPTRGQRTPDRTHDRRRGGQACFVIAPGKSDIVNYYGARIGPARIAYIVQAEPAGLCDAIFSVPAPSSRRMSRWLSACLTPSGSRGWPNATARRYPVFPALPRRPSLNFFDAVVTDPTGRVEEI